MAIKTFDDLVQDFKDLILQSLPNANLEPGTLFRDVIIDVPSYLLSLLYEDLRSLQLAQSIETAQGEDLDKLLGNFGLFRLPGTRATGAVYFRHPSPPAEGITIPAGTIVATQPSLTSPAVLFKTTQSVIITSDSDLYNSDLGMYEKSCPIVAVEPGSASNVGANTITTILSLDNAVPGLSVINLTPTSGGSDTESDDAFRNRGLGVLRGINFGTKEGLQQLLRTDPEVLGCKVVTAEDSGEDLRRVSEGGADVWVQIEITDEAVEYFTVSSSTRAFYPQHRPLVDVSLVKNSATGEIINDYSVSRDTGIFERSVYALDRVTIGETVPDGTKVEVRYVWIPKVRELQERLDSSSYRILTADSVVKAAYPADVDVTFKISYLRGYDPNIVATNVVNAVTEYINSLGLGEDVQQSQIVYLAEATAGVDAVLIPFTTFQVEHYTGDVETGDGGLLLIGSKEYARARTVVVEIIG